MKLDPVLLEILVCPACRATVTVDHAAEELVCNGCGRAYPVRDDIPVMLVDEARLPAPVEAAGEAADESPSSDQPVSGGAAPSADDA